MSTLNTSDLRALDEEEDEVDDADNLPTGSGEHHGTDEDGADEEISTSERDIGEDLSEKNAEESGDEDESTVDEDEDDELTVKSDDASAVAQGALKGTSSPKPKGSKAVASSSKRGRSPSVKGLTIPFRTVKKAMKVDPDTPIVQNEAAVMTTIAAELFLKRLANESFRNAKRRGRNTIRYEDIAEARTNNPSLLFLETLLP